MKCFTGPDSRSMCWQRRPVSRPPAAAFRSWCTKDLPRHGPTTRSGCRAANPPLSPGIIDDPARTYLDFLTEQASRARMMCSVCDGAMLLAAAGLLDGYQATTHWAFTSCFPQRFPKVLVTPGHPRFVHDRNRLTAGGVASGLDAALKLIELLGGTKLAQRVQQDTQYYPDPPVSSEIPLTPAECPIPSSAA